MLGPISALGTPFGVGIGVSWLLDVAADVEVFQVRYITVRDTRICKSEERVEAGTLGRLIIGVGYTEGLLVPEIHG